jgi:hypothetical protein
MANIVQKVIDKLAVALKTPLYIQNRQQAAEEMYSRPQVGLQRRSWAARCSETLNLNGLIYRCGCDQEFVFPSVLEAMKDFTCPQCKEKFVEVLKFVGIDPKETAVNLWESIILAKLPRVPFSVGGRRSPFLSFGDENTDHASPAEAARIKAMELGDPAAFGPGF